jgi:NAD(P)H-dependent FMN reductase
MQVVGIKFFFIFMRDTGMYMILKSLAFFALTMCGGCTAKNQVDGEKMLVQIIMGSTRQGRSSDKIAHAIKTMIDARGDVKTELVDLRDYPLPFLYEEVAPSRRTVITDSAIQKWSDKIKQGDAYIIVAPEYNAGYPGVLKNALDMLYKEWENKPVGLVGYSGGPSGAAAMLVQLRVVAQELGMVPVQAEVRIPTSWKAFNAKGQLVDAKHIESDVKALVDQIVRARR